MKFQIVIIGLFALFASCDMNTEDCISVDLKCEYLINPIGIDSPQPRLRWKLEDQRSGAIQTAYEIIVGTNAADVINGIGLYLRLN